MQVLFTPAAQQSLQEIYDYIAEDNPGKAKEFFQHLKKQCFVLAENPRMGGHDLNFKKPFAVSLSHPT
jgi:plasmid stabilization system protein ParE